MPADDARREDVSAWLSKASLDLRAAEVELSSRDDGLLGDVLFHAQQAAEKSLKALLAWHDVPFRKTHDLEELGRTCLAIAPTLRGLVDEAVILTPYAWRFRYPGDVEEPSRTEATEAVELAKRLRDAVVAVLPSLSR